MLSIPHSPPRYEVMFISTVTMAISATPWQRDMPVSTIAQGTLCPAMRRFPNIGSMGTEIIVAGVSLLRPVVNLIVSLPGLVEIWQKQKPCPALVTRGHSLLRKCGSDLLSLDDFFDALNRANAHYWRAFGMVAERVRDLGDNRLANVLDGVAYYGESTLSPTQQYASVVRSFRMPVSEVAGTWTSRIFVMSPTTSASAVTISTNPLRVAQFSYRLVTGVIVDLIPLFIRVQQSDGRDIDATREILFILNNHFYNAREGYYSSVTLGMLQGCNALSLIVGYDNPWAVLLRKQCESLPISIQVCFVPWHRIFRTRN